MRPTCRDAECSQRISTLLHSVVLSVVSQHYYIRVVWSIIVEYLWGKMHCANIGKTHWVLQLYHVKRREETRSFPHEGLMIVRHRRAIDHMEKNIHRGIQRSRTSTHRVSVRGCSGPLPQFQIISHKLGKPETTLCARLCAPLFGPRRLKHCRVGLQFFS